LAKKKRTDLDSGEQITFEQSLEKLEQIVHELEDGQLGLSESLVRYEEGVKHLKQCYDALQKAERKIELLAGVDAAGNPVTEPFDDEASSLDEKHSQRKRRRSRPTATKAKLDDDDDSDDVDEVGGLF